MAEEMDVIGVISALRGNHRPEDETEDESEDESVYEVWIDDSCCAKGSQALADAIESGRQYGRAIVRLVDRYSKGKSAPKLPYASINRSHRCFHNEPLFNAHRCLYHMGKISRRNPRLRDWLRKMMTGWTPGLEISAWALENTVDRISEAAVGYLDHETDKWKGGLYLTNGFSIFFMAMHRTEEEKDVDSDSPWRSPGPLIQWPRVFCYCELGSEGYLGACWCGMGPGGSIRDYKQCAERDKVHWSGPTLKD